MTGTGDSVAPGGVEAQPAPWPGEFEVRLEGPLDVPASLEVFRRWGDDLMDRWDGVTLVRTLPVDGGSIAYACRSVGTVERPALRVVVENPIHREMLEQAVHSTFVTPPSAYRDLLQSDSVVARLEALFVGHRPVLQFDLLGALVRSISSQQVNLSWAVTTRRRLAEAFGVPHLVAGHTVYHLDAQRLARTDPGDVRSLQFTTRKAEYLVEVAAQIAAGQLELTRLKQMADEEVILTLTSIRGIGLWTAEWLLARTLGRPRVVAGDLGVRKAVGLAYLGDALPPEERVRQATAHWGASAGVAQTLLLQGLVKGVFVSPRDNPSV